MLIKMLTVAARALRLLRKRRLWRFRSNSVDASDQNRSLGDEQLDDSIVDTLVWAVLLMSACRKGYSVSSQGKW